MFTSLKFWQQVWLRVDFPRLWTGVKVFARAVDSHTTSLSSFFRSRTLTNPRVGWETFFEATQEMKVCGAVPPVYHALADI